MRPVALVLNHPEDVVARKEALPGCSKLVFRQHPIPLPRRHLPTQRPLCASMFAQVHRIKCLILSVIHHSSLPIRDILVEVLARNCHGRRGDIFSINEIINLS